MKRRYTFAFVIAVSIIQSQAADADMYVAQGINSGMRYVGNCILASGIICAISIFFGFRAHRK